MVVVVFWGVSGDQGQVHGVRYLPRRRVSEAFGGDGRAFRCLRRGTPGANAAESAAAVSEVIVLIAPFIVRISVVLISGTTTLLYQDQFRCQANSWMDPVR